MMLATHQFTEALKTGTEVGKRIEDLTRQLASLMEEMYDSKCRLDVSLDVGYVLIAKR